MYVTSVNEAYALDARNGREIWHYSRPRSQGLAGDAASGINRGVAVLGDRVFMVSDNAHLFALHRFTGQLIWDVEMADSRQNYGSTGAPLVVNDLVVAGVSGGDEGVRGFLDAYKASTGERAWRFWTVPAPGEPGSETWSGRAMEHGCGATWLTGTYDPEARLLYWPTGNPCPDYNGDERKGDNLYTASVVALDPATGKLKWHYQFTPHDLHDWDATETPVLVDANFRGQPRKLLLHGNRNGFFYVLDRLTGKVLVAEPFVKKLTWASGIGPDGRPILLPGNEPTVEGQLVCPAVAGAANWPSNAYNPATGLFYMFAEESCNIYSKNDQWWEAGKSFYGGGTRRAPDSGGGKFLKAIDIQTGKTKWEIPEIGGGILASGLMATAGGLIFYGDGGGAFVAADASNGKLLWHFNTGQSWKAGPMTYTVDGRQYIGMAAGSTIMAFALAAAPQTPPAPQAAAARQFELKAESPKFWELIAQDAKLEKIAGGFGFTEGPVWDPKGFLYVSDEEKNKLSRVYPDGRVETVLEIGDPDGSTLDAKGRLVTTASVLRAIIQVDPDGKYKVLADKFEGKKFNSPNDVILGPRWRAVFHRSHAGLAEGRKAGASVPGRVPSWRRRIGAAIDHGSHAAQRPRVLAGRQAPLHRRHEDARDSRLRRWRERGAEKRQGIRQGGRPRRCSRRHARRCRGQCLGHRTRRHLGLGSGRPSHRHHPDAGIAGQSQLGRRRQSHAVYHRENVGLPDQNEGTGFCSGALSSASLCLTGKTAARVPTLVRKWEEACPFRTHPDPAPDPKNRRSRSAGALRHRPPCCRA